MISRVNFIFIHSALIVLLLGLPFLSFAQSLTYQPLVGIPGVNNTATDFNLYINQLYFLSISLAALLAVIKIIIGGVKWMLTDVVTSKSDAKNDIRSALLGLLLIVSAVLILGTINPQLRQLNVLGGAPALNQLPGTGARPTDPLVPGASPNNPTLTNNNAVGSNVRSNQIPGEVITTAPNGQPFTNTARIQAQQNCERRTGFVLGYTVRAGDGQQRFTTTSPNTPDIVSIHCTPPATP
jgi:uncharacterized membrane protein